MTLRKKGSARNKIMTLKLRKTQWGRVIMFFEGLLKYKGILQDMAIIEALKYQKHKARDFIRISF